MAKEKPKGCAPGAVADYDDVIDALTSLRERELVCSYFSTPGFSASDLYLDRCIKYLQAEFRSVDMQLGFALQEEQQGLN